MNLRRRLALLLGLMLLTVAPSLGQTASDLRQKYGAPDDEGHYTVRTGIVLSVTLAKNGQARKILIEAKDLSTSSRGRIKSMPLATAKEIINELVPIARRGKHLRSIIFNSGCASMSTEEYEEVRTSIVTTTCAEADSVTSAQIVWKSPDDPRLACKKQKRVRPAILRFHWPPVQDA